MFKLFHIRKFEVGLRFVAGEFQSLMFAGKHRLFDPMNRTTVRIVSKRDPWIVDEQLDVIIQSGALEGLAQVVDLKDSQRGLVWIDGRFARTLGAGLYAFWLAPRTVRVEIVDARDVRLVHDQLKSIVRGADAARLLDVCTVGRDCTGVLFIDGRFVAQLSPGLYAFWKDAAESRIVEVDIRETQVDVAGQDIMTADKVTLRLNAIVTYVVQDAHRAVRAAADPRQAVYRETQLALRAAIGTRELDTFLAEKDELARELEAMVRTRAESLGLQLISVGIKDVILPGDMKELLNRVTEAKKVAEANLIARREETAAIRSQANTAKLLADNPTLMRLRELEVLEKIVASGKLNVVLGDKGLADRVVHMI